MLTNQKNVKFLVYVDTFSPLCSLYVYIINTKRLFRKQLPCVNTFNLTFPVWIHPVFNPIINPIKHKDIKTTPWKEKIWTLCIKTILFSCKMSSGTFSCTGDGQHPNRSENISNRIKILIILIYSHQIKFMSALLNIRLTNNCWKALYLIVLKDFNWYLWEISYNWIWVYFLILIM